MSCLFCWAAVLLPLVHISFLEEETTFGLAFSCFWSHTTGNWRISRHGIYKSVNQYPACDNIQVNSCRCSKSLTTRWRWKRILRCICLRFTWLKLPITPMLYDTTDHKKTQDKHRILLTSLSLNSSPDLHLLKCSYRSRLKNLSNEPSIDQEVMSFRIDGVLIREVEHSRFPCLPWLLHSTMLFLFYTSKMRLHVRGLSFAADVIYVRSLHKMSDNTIVTP